jgi:hypothetical protein
VEFGKATAKLDRKARERSSSFTYLSINSFVSGRRIVFRVGSLLIGKVHEEFAAQGDQ